MKIGLDNYRVGQKDNWRKWQWNRVAERLDPGSDGYVLYLPAEQDLDRKIAISKGIHPDRLVAVDMRAGVVRDIRRQKKTAVQGKLHAVIANWPAGRPIDAVIADFCCGLTREVVIDFTQALWQSQEALHSGNNGYGAIISINLQRGREAPLLVNSTISELSDAERIPVSGVVDRYIRARSMVTVWAAEDLLNRYDDKRFNREKSAKFVLCKPSMLPHIGKQSCKSFLDVVKDPKHRGLIFFEAFWNAIYPHYRLTTISEDWREYCGLKRAADEGMSEEAIYFSYWQGQIFWRLFIRGLPVFTSYRSSRVVMDSAVFRFGYFTEDIFEHGFPFSKEFICGKQRRAIAAALAVNTMRRTGRLARGAV